ncbi:hypothetical protein L218DRAFT_1072401 [Marasmius fiardii PR-910]|nr:hypothetical protein L218DRAFT_1072401 [Marasmius fiardii PR-910]
MSTLCAYTQAYILADIHVGVQGLEDMLVSKKQAEENKTSSSSPQPTPNSSLEVLASPKPSKQITGPPSTNGPPTAQQPAIFTIIKTLRDAVECLPSTIPLGTEAGPLSGYSVDPAALTADCADDDLIWESGWDSQLTCLIPKDISQVCLLVLHGKYGLIGLVNLMEHLVHDRKLTESLLEQKVKHLLAAISQVAQQHAVQQPEPSSTSVAVTKKVAAPKQGGKDSWAIPDKMGIHHRLENTESERHIEGV